MSYLAWNDALARRFFCPEMAGKPVYLYVTEELLGHVADEIGSEPKDFIEVIKAGPPWSTRQGVCQKAWQAFDNWRARRLTYPPYIAYLSFFVLAAGAEGSWAPHAYYPRPWSLLGEQRRDMLPSFDRMADLWEDLEQWSITDRAGELGNFHAHSAGSWVHVGYPIGQVILDEHERHCLPAVFAAAELDPTSLPSQAQLAAALRMHGGGCLRNRTQRLLTGRQDSETMAILLSAVRDELAMWNGEVLETGSRETRAARVQASLRTCLRLNAVAGTLHSELRCKLNRDYPDGALSLTGLQAGEVTCSEQLEGWSTPLVYIESGRPVSVADFDWRRGLTLREPSLHWQLRLAPAPVRVFVSGQRDGIPGLVEVNELTRAQQCHVLADAASWPAVEAWGASSCEGFQRINISSALPSGWNLASIRRVLDDSPIRAHFPVLSFGGAVRIRLKGGLRSTRGNNFFAFAAPQVVLDEAAGDEELMCAGEKLTPCGEGVYQLPATLPVDQQLVLEVWSGKELSARLSLYLTSGAVWQRTAAAVRLDCRGISQPGAEPGVAGATVVGGEDLAEYRPSPLLAKGIEPLLKGPIHFLGNVPGQISSWPAEPLPANWSPIWAIGGGKRKKVVYCGTTIDASMPTGGSVGSRSQVEAWKSFLWHRRKRVVPPADPRLASLWKHFEERARHA